MTPTYRPAFVNLDDVYPCNLPCFLPEERWNGAACPHFTKQVADLIAAASPIDEGSETVTYDVERDVYVMTMPTSTGEPLEDRSHVVHPVNIVVDGTPHHVYPVGAWNWTWQEYQTTTCGYCRSTAWSLDDRSRCAVCAAEGSE